MRGQHKIIHYLDGYLQESLEKHLQRLTPGCLSGPGMFETMRTVKGEVFLLEPHLDRLTAGLKLIGLKNPFSVERWQMVIRKTMEANHLMEARVRIMVWEEGGHQECSVIVRPLVLPSAAVYRKGYKLAVVDERRPVTRLSHVKSTEYGIFSRVLEQAQVRLCDEAVLLNGNDKVVEASRSNLFWIKDNVLFTPSVAAGCLAGITRQTVLRIVRAQGVKVRLVQASLTSLLRADAVFLTNSVIGVMPVRSIEDKRMNSGHEMIVSIREQYKKLLSGSSLYK